MKCIPSVPTFCMHAHELMEKKLVGKKTNWCFQCVHCDQIWYYYVTSARVMQMWQVHRARPGVNLWRILCVGAWNIEPLGWTSTTPLVRWIQGAESGHSGFSEMRRPGNEEITSGGYTNFWSGQSDGAHPKGVAIAISSQVQSSFVGVTPPEEHLWLHISYCSICSNQDVKT